MADISVTAANVYMVSGEYIDATAGEAITAGQVVYLSTADDRVYKCDADLSSTASEVYGIAINSAPGVAQPVRIQISGIINIGGTVAVGEIYISSDTAGGVRPVGDVDSGDYISFLGIGTTTARIDLTITNSGVQKP